jgi:hypothetical protein
MTEHLMAEKDELWMLLAAQALMAGHLMID